MDILEKLIINSDKVNTLSSSDRFKFYIIHLLTMIEKNREKKVIESYLEQENSYLNKETLDDYFNEIITDLAYSFDELYDDNEMDKKVELLQKKYKSIFDGWNNTDFCKIAYEICSFRYEKLENMGKLLSDVSNNKFNQFKAQYMKINKKIYKKLQEPDLPGYEVPSLIPEFNMDKIVDFIKEDSNVDYIMAFKNNIISKYVNDEPGKKLEIQYPLLKVKYGGRIPGNKLDIIIIIYCVIKIFNVKPSYEREDKKNKDLIRYVFILDYSKLKKTNIQEEINRYKPVLKKSN